MTDQTKRRILESVVAMGKYVSVYIDGKEFRGRPILPRGGDRRLFRLEVHRYLPHKLLLISEISFSAP
jgi:hypothetical protein